MYIVSLLSVLPTFDVMLPEKRINVHNNINTVVHENYLHISLCGSNKQTLHTTEGTMIIIYLKQTISNGSVSNYSIQKCELSLHLISFTLVIKLLCNIKYISKYVHIRLIIIVII